MIINETYLKKAVKKTVKQDVTERNIIETPSSQRESLLTAEENYDMTFLVYRYISKNSQGNYKNSKEFKTFIREIYDLFENTLTVREVAPFIAVFETDASKQTIQNCVGEVNYNYSVEYVNDEIPAVIALYDNNNDFCSNAVQYVIRIKYGLSDVVNVMRIFMKFAKRIAKLDKYFNTGTYNTYIGFNRNVYRPQDVIQWCYPLEVIDVNSKDSRVGMGGLVDLLNNEHVTGDLYERLSELYEVDYRPKLMRSLRGRVFDNSEVYNVDATDIKIQKFCEAASSARVMNMRHCSEFDALNYNDFSPEEMRTYIGNSCGDLNPNTLFCWFDGSEREPVEDNLDKITGKWLYRDFYRRLWSVDNLGEQIAWCMVALGMDSIDDILKWAETDFECYRFWNIPHDEDEMKKLKSCIKKWFKVYSMRPIRN